MQYNLQVPDISLEELKIKVANGGRFLIFRTTFSLIAISFDIPSNAIFIENDLEREKHARWRNIISGIFGWWNLRYGIVNTMNAISSNQKGKWDVTLDVMENITEESLAGKYVNVIRIVETFVHPGKSERKAIEKTLLRAYPENYHLSEVYAGLNIEDDPSILVIAYRPGKTFEITHEEASKTLRKEFRKGTFMLYNLNDYDALPEFLDDLKSQGLTMKKAID